MAPMAESEARQKKVLEGVDFTAAGFDIFMTGIPSQICMNRTQTAGQGCQMV
jgi:hypothetical protein